MRKDEEGNECPETIGEYRKFCEDISLYGEDCAAVEYLDSLLEGDGVDEHSKASVSSSDFRMKMLLLPMTMNRRTGSTFKP